MCVICEWLISFYTITKETEEIYIASLKAGSMKRNGVPEAVTLKKANGSWQAGPWREEIIPGLTDCIEATVDY